MTTQTADRRIVRHDGWITTQIRRSDGTWWNIKVERATGR